MPERTLTMPSLTNSLDVSATLPDPHLHLDVHQLGPNGEEHQG